MLSDTLTYIEGADWNYDIAGSTLSTPSDTDIITRFTVTRAMKLPAAFAGVQMDAGTPPTTLATLTVKKNGTGLTNGTITYSSGDVVTPNPSFAETSFAPGDVIEIEVTTADSIDDIGITLKTVAG